MRCSPAGASRLISAALLILPASIGTGRPRLDALLLYNRMLSDSVDPPNPSRSTAHERQTWREASHREGRGAVPSLEFLHSRTEGGDEPGVARPDLEIGAAAQIGATRSANLRRLRPRGLRCDDPDAHSSIAIFICSAVLESLAESLRYNHLHESRFREPGMHPIPSLDGPLKASRQLSGLMARPAGCRVKVPAED